MNFPENVKYTPDHEWIKVDGDNAYIGVTDFAQGELGDVVFVEVTTLGENVKQGDIFGSIEAVKTVSDLMMPVGGEVLESNPQLEETPELVNKDPYGEGWIIKISINDVAELDSLMSAEAYKKFIGK